MTEAADLLFTNAEVHTLTGDGGSGDEVHEALAVRDGKIVAVGTEYEVEFLEGVETDVVDCEGRVVLPGFVDAHTHLQQLGQYRVHADLSKADSVEDCRDLLRAELETDDGWAIGFGYDESGWDEPRYPTREDLDAVSEERPVVAIRVDMHAASLNSAALERLRGRMPEADVETAEGEPTGVVVEEAAEAVWEAVAPDRPETRELLLAAQEYALARGVTCVHDMVRNSHAPRVYRELSAEGELDLRVRLNYWSDHLEALAEVGLATNAGSERVRTGAVKTYTDGSLGSRTAKLFEPYEDGDGRGQWVVDPGELHEFVERADAEGFQVAAHAIGDEAVEEVLAAYDRTDGPGAARHRIEHAELATDDHVERLAETGVVASMQPNFLRWAEAGGLYDRRVGVERRKRADRLRTLVDAGVTVAFGSDCMPLDPLFGVHCAVNAPTEVQRLTVTEALRAYTRGGAYAGFDEDRLGTIEVGKRADLVVLESSPWERPDRIEGIDVVATVVDGEVVYDGR